MFLGIFKDTEEILTHSNKNGLTNEVTDIHCGMCKNFESLSIFLQQGHRTHYIIKKWKTNTSGAKRKLMLF